MREEKLYRFIVQAACFSCCMLLFLGGGCGGEKGLSEEELAAIPFAKRDGFPEASGGFVLAACGETITSEEIIRPTLEYFGPIAQENDFERFKALARPELEQLVVNKLSNILLYQKAKRLAGEQIDEVLERIAEGEVKKFITSFNGDWAKAEEVLKQDGMDWASFKEYQKRMILSQNYVQRQLPRERPIMYGELMRYYERLKGEAFTTPAAIQFQLIDIQPAKVEVSDANQSKEQAARELASELAGRLKDGEDFGELAKEYSHGHRAMFGGQWKSVGPESLAEPYDILAVEAERIEPGQITGPIEAGGHIFIMKLHKKRTQSVEPFAKVQKEVEARINFERRKRAVDEFGTRLVEQAAVGNKDAFVDYCLERIYILANK